MDLLVVFSDSFAGRSLRTMQKNLASLHAKHLLVERAERKVFRGREGGNTSRMVIVKDFAALYGLAHEYHEWLQAEDTIPPERAFASIISQNPSLVAKLRRFDNYRRLLYNHVPGPGPGAQEEDRWFTEYHPGEHATEAADQQPASALASKTLPKELAKEMSKASPKRISESSQRDGSRGDSFDSASSLSEKSLKKGGTGSYTLPDQPTSNSQNTEQRSRSTVALQQATKQPGQAWPGQHPEYARHASVYEREETSQEVQMAREAMSMTNHSQPAQRRRDQAHDCSSSPPRPPDHPLARSFLQEIAAPFGDRNPKGSITRVLGIIANASLEEAEVLLCLVRAYTIARDTRTLRPVHSERETGRANRMPLFCTLFERFVQARVHNGRWNYSWQQMEDDLVADDRLRLWWMEQQALFSKEERGPEEGLSAPDEQAYQGEQDEAFSIAVGWARREAAHYWGEQLLEALMAAGYEAEVRVRIVGQWYQLVLLGEGCELVLETPEHVQFVIEQAERGSL